MASSFSHASIVVSIRVAIRAAVARGDVGRGKRRSWKKEKGIGEISRGEG